MKDPGWVPLRRGILEHVQDGRLPRREFAAYCLMILCADHKTGKWKGSASLLQNLLHIRRQKAQEVVRYLAEHHYIELPPVIPRKGGYWIRVVNYFGNEKRGSARNIIPMGKRQTGTSKRLRAQIGNLKREHITRSTSLQEENLNTQEGDMRAFEELFAAYPDHRRSEWDAKLAWNGLPLIERDMQAIMVGLEAWKASAEWKRDDGRYVPSLTKFIRERRWKIKPRKESKRDDPNEKLKRAAKNLGLRVG